MRVAVLGGGQLARMMALAGTPLGMSFAFLDPAPDAPAGALGRHVRAGFEDPEGLDALGQWADAVTRDFENVPAASAHRPASIASTASSDSLTTITLGLFTAAALSPGHPRRVMRSPPPQRRIRG